MSKRAFAFVLLVCPVLSTANCAGRAHSCLIGQDETSLIQTNKAKWSEDQKGHLTKKAKLQNLLSKGRWSEDRWSEEDDVKHSAKAKGNEQENLLNAAKAIKLAPATNIRAASNVEDTSGRDWHQALDQGKEDEFEHWHQALGIKHLASIGTGIKHLPGYQIYVKNSAKATAKGREKSAIDDAIERLAKAKGMSVERLHRLIRAFKSSAKARASQVNASTHSKQMPLAPVMMDPAAGAPVVTDPAQIPLDVTQEIQGASWLAAPLVDFPFQGAMPTLSSRPKRMTTVNLAMMALNVPGDFVETGVYFGGTAVLLAKILQTNDNGQRRLWAADSFAGLPSEDPGEIANTAPAGSAVMLSTAGSEVAQRETFEKNMELNGVGPSQFPPLTILQGWFSDTLHAAPIQQIAFLRLDGDIYVSTRDALNALYDKVVPGGYIYVDDYGSYKGCHHALDEFCGKRGCNLMYPVHETGDPNSYDAVWFQKPANNFR